MSRVTPRFWLASAALAAAVVLLALSCGVAGAAARVGSKAGLLEYAAPPRPAGVAPSYVVPAAPAHGSVADFTFNLLPTNGVTARWTTLRNPAVGWHVYVPGGGARCKDGLRETVSVQAAREKCLAATNSVPFSYAKKAECFGPIVSDGRLVEPRSSSGVPTCIGLLRHNNSFVLGDNHVLTKMAHEMRFQQLVCGFGWLVVNNRTVPSQEKLIAPRTAFGVDARGQLLSVVADGSEAVMKGLTLNQTADRMLRLGAVFAINFDGGGSSTSFLESNGGVQGCPSDRDSYCCVERDVSAISCLK